MTPVRKLAPEVWFENRWEASDPVRVVNLLEHTTGWDDMHLHEYAVDAPPSLGLREALDSYHRSRISRWPPGTRMAYCNSGPPVAAYIVEKITHQRFEDYRAAESLSADRNEDRNLFSAARRIRDDSLSPRWQDALPLLEHRLSPRGFDQCFRS